LLSQSVKNTYTLLYGKENFHLRPFS
jgi:hypothetical protein